MKSTLTITRGSYGFGYNWTLNCETKTTKKSFYLGQDSKFSRRVFGMNGRDLMSVANISEIKVQGENKKLATFIAKKLGLNGWNIKKLETWELCAE